MGVVIVCACECVALCLKRNLHNVIHVCWCTLNTLTHCLCIFKIIYAHVYSGDAIH